MLKTSKNESWVFNIEGRGSQAFRLWVRGLMVANVGFEYRNRSSILIVHQIMDDGFRQVVYIVP